MDHIVVVYVNYASKSFALTARLASYPNWEMLDTAAARSGYTELILAECLDKDQADEMKDFTILAYTHAGYNKVTLHSLIYAAEPEAVEEV